jgi:hypothetical protein
MICLINTKYFQMADKNDPEYQKDRAYQEERLRQYDRMVPAMKKVLGFTARLTWKMMKVLVKTAVRIPGFTYKLIKAAKPPSTHSSDPRHDHRHDPRHDPRQ